MNQRNQLYLDINGDHNKLWTSLIFNVSFNDLCASWFSWNSETANIEFFDICGFSFSCSCSLCVDWGLRLQLVWMSSFASHENLLQKIIWCCQLVSLQTIVSWWIVIPMLSLKNPLGFGEFDLRSTWSRSWSTDSTFLTFSIRILGFPHLNISFWLASTDRKLWNMFSPILRKRWHCLCRLKVPCYDSVLVLQTDRNPEIHPGSTFSNRTPLFSSGSLILLLLFLCRFRTFSKTFFGLSIFSLTNFWNVCANDPKSSALWHGGVIFWSMIMIVRLCQWNYFSVSCFPMRSPIDRSSRLVKPNLLRCVNFKGLG